MILNIIGLGWAGLGLIVGVLSCKYVSMFVCKYVWRSARLDVRMIGKLVVAINDGAVQYG